MFKERVDQKAIIAIREGKNSAQKPGPQPNLPPWLRMGPKPWAATSIQIKRKKATTSTKGAAQFSNRRNVSMPRRMMAIWITQKMAKLSHWVQGMPASGAALSQALPNSAPARVYTAWPPIQLWMPNQPQAMKARSRAGTLAPKTPNEARASTG